MSKKSVKGAVLEPETSGLMHHAAILPNLYIRQALMRWRTSLTGRTQSLRCCSWPGLADLHSQLPDFLLWPRALHFHPPVTASAHPTACISPGARRQS